MSFILYRCDSSVKNQFISVVHRSDRNRVLDLLCEISGMLPVEPLT